jgi:signal transduction histidine kinase/FixJ family two-component response regulator
MRQPTDEARSLEVPLSGSTSAASSGRSQPSRFTQAANAIGTFAGRMPLRSKFWLSLALVIVVMTAGTLLALRQSLQTQAQHQVEQEARNALLTFQLMTQQQRAALVRKAELLATLALLREGDVTTLRDISQDPWQSDDCDLFALVDATGHVTSLQARSPQLSPEAANKAIASLLRTPEPREWLDSGSRLYQVVTEPYYRDPPFNTVVLGKAVVGREIDANTAKNLARILSTEVLFQGAGTTVSSFFPFQEREVSKQLQLELPSKEVHLGKQRFFASVLALESGGLSFVVLKSADDAFAALARFNHLLLGLGLVAVVAGGALVFLISHTFTQPLATLVEGVHALEQGNFSYPLAPVGNDEVARVTRAFESMRGTLQRNEVQREQLEGQLRQSQKMDALGRLAGGVAHDFNNLLTVIKGHSDLVLEHVEPADPIRGSCEQIRRVSDRAAALTRQLLAFSRCQMLQPKVLDLNELIIEMGKLLRRLLREDIEYNLRLGESLARVHADPGQIEQVLLNLTVNAADAMPSGGTLTIETQNIHVDDGHARSRPGLASGDFVMLSITDSGHGMTPDLRARIFEPFFTTKEEGKGTGLGLATVYGIVKQSSGYIDVQSAPGEGTRFDIYLPQVRGQVEAAAVEQRSNGALRRRGTVLVVEDQDDVRALTCEFLKSAGYQVLTAADGAEALAVGERCGKSIRVLVTDVVMPRMSGTEVARKLQDLLPDLKVVYTSGYLDEFVADQGGFAGNSFLQKPFSRDALLREVDTLLSGKAPDKTLGKAADKTDRALLQGVH